MNIEFFKYQATGNDFVLLNGMTSDQQFDAKLISKLCDRHFGIGSDGLIIAKPSETADLFMDYYNSDGTIAEMCGNGVRALAAFAIDSGIVDQNNNNIKIDTRAGLKEIALKDGIFTVNMGKASFSNEDIGFDSTVLMWDFPIEVEGKVFAVYGASMGNPHCIIFTDNINQAPVMHFGSIIENYPLFKNRINVEWVQVVDKQNMFIKVWERGVGYTLACGTGACASFVVAKRLNLVDKQANISLPGGQLQVELADENLLLSGKAGQVFKGSIDI